MALLDTLRLEGRTALVTGGTQGIGKALALGLAELGADLVLGYHLGEEAARETRSEVCALGRRCGCFPIDLSAVNAPEKLYEEVKAAGFAVDILVLNASLQIRKAWGEVTPEEFDRQMHLNLRSSLQLIQVAYPEMRARGWGRILTVGSVQQVRPHPEMIVYSASKAAQVNLVKSLAHQLAPHGVTINNLAPGAIETGRNREALADETYRKQVEQKIPIGRLGQPQDCAALAGVLCSDAGGYITGQDILVDGGMGLCT